MSFLLLRPNEISFERGRALLIAADVFAVTVHAGVWSCVAGAAFITNRFLTTFFCHDFASMTAPPASCCSGLSHHWHAAEFAYMLTLHLRTGLQEGSGRRTAGEE